MLSWKAMAACGHKLLMRTLLWSLVWYMESTRPQTEGKQCRLGRQFLFLVPIWWTLHSVYFWFPFMYLLLVDLPHSRLKSENDVRVRTRLCPFSAFICWKDVIIKAQEKQSIISQEASMLPWILKIIDKNRRTINYDQKIASLLLFKKKAFISLANE